MDLVKYIWLSTIVAGVIGYFFGSGFMVFLFFMGVISLIYYYFFKRG